MPKAPKRKKKYSENEPLDEFMHMNSWRENCASAAFIELLCGKMLEFFANPESLCFEEFLIAKHIQSSTYTGWLKKHKKLAETHQFIKMMIATRREKGMVKGEFESKPIMYIQHQYSDNWKEADKYWAELKKYERDTEDKHTVVIIDKLKDKAEDQEEEKDVEL